MPGNLAKIESHPWMAYVTINSQWSCSASLIPHKKAKSAYLITAANCFEEAENLITNHM